MKGCNIYLKRLKWSTTNETKQMSLTPGPFECLNDGLSDLRLNNFEKYSVTKPSKLNLLINFMVDKSHAMYAT